MTKRHTYHVTHKGGTWNVKRQGQVTPVSSHRTKAEAVEHGRRAAKDEVLGQLVIHRRDGQIQTEHTYGMNPYPPTG